jgi:hypothetical protein
MTDEEYHQKMFTLTHKADCDWHCDQYWWECNCGAVPVTELIAERDRRRKEGIAS